MKIKSFECPKSIKNCEKKVLETYDAWSTSHLSKLPMSQPVYHTVDCRIFIKYLSWENLIHELQDHLEHLTLNLTSRYWRLKVLRLLTLVALLKLKKIHLFSLDLWSDQLSKRTHGDLFLRISLGKQAVLGIQNGEKKYWRSPPLNEDVKNKIHISIGGIPIKHKKWKENTDASK